VAGAAYGKDVRTVARAATALAPGEKAASIVAGADAGLASEAVGLASGTASAAGTGDAAATGDAAGETRAEPGAAEASSPKATGKDRPDPLHRRPGHEPAIEGAAERRPDLEARLAQIGASAHPSPANAAASFALPHVAAPSGTTHAAASPAPPVFTAVPTPVGHPGFADRFAGEIGTLALRGIEQAEIVLNPRELGPVRIELSLNGEAARIAFSAAQPETRHAIEQTLPVLKDLLANHGLMLSDTSVSDGRAGQGTAGGSAFGRPPAPPAASAGPGGTTSPGTIVPRSVGLRGLVDLYA
jgi:flagellar hook-length control protein FliK